MLVDELQDHVVDPLEGVVELGRRGERALAEARVVGRHEVVAVGRAGSGCGTSAMTSGSRGAAAASAWPGRRPRGRIGGHDSSFMASRTGVVGHLLRLRLRAGRRARRRTPRCSGAGRRAAPCRPQAPCPTCRVTSVVSSRPRRPEEGSEPLVPLPVGQVGVHTVIARCRRRTRFRGRATRQLSDVGLPGPKSFDGAGTAPPRRTWSP